jgi:hypothetical protein
VKNPPRGFSFSYGVKFYAVPSHTYLVADFSASGDSRVFFATAITSLITWAGLLLVQAIFVLFCTHFLKARQPWKFAWI